MGAMREYAKRKNYFTATLSQKGPRYNPNLEIIVPESKAAEFLSHWDEFLQEMYPAVTTTITAQLNFKACELKSTKDETHAAAGAGRFGEKKHPLIAEHASGGRIKG